AVHEHDLGIGFAPHQCADPTAVACVDELASDRGRAPPRDVVLLGVLLEEPELVVLDGGHAHEPIPRRRSVLTKTPRLPCAAMRLPRLSPAQYQRVTVGAAALLAVIIVTGGAVRLTGSGLGCPEWPNCEAGRVTPYAASDFHAMVEFVNRLVTGLVSIAVVVAVLGSLVRLPRRLDLVVLSLGLVIGVVVQ